MYRIVLDTTVLTKPLETLDKAVAVKKELLAKFFPDYPEDALYIIDEHGIPVARIFDDGRIKRV